MIFSRQLFVDVYVIHVLCAERAWNMTIPGFSTEEQHAAPIKKSSATEAHKQVCCIFGSKARQ